MYGSTEVKKYPHSKVKDMYMYVKMYVPETMIGQKKKGKIRTSFSLLWQIWTYSSNLWQIRTNLSRVTNTNVFCCCFFTHINITFVKNSYLVKSQNWPYMYHLQKYANSSHTCGKYEVWKIKFNRALLVGSDMRTYNRRIYTASTCSNTRRELCAALHSSINKERCILDCTKYMDSAFL